MAKKAWHQNFKRSPEQERTSPDGIVHHSAEEKNRWCKLLFDQKMGLVRNVCRQVVFKFVIDIERSVKTPTGRVMQYKADFVYDRLDRGVWIEVIEDHKGFLDTTSQLRIAVFEAIHQKKVTIHKN